MWLCVWSLSTIYVFCFKKINIKIRTQNFNLLPKVTWQDQTCSVLQHRAEGTQEVKSEFGSYAQKTANISRIESTDLDEHMFRNGTLRLRSDFQNAAISTYGCSSRYLLGTEKTFIHSYSAVLLPALQQIFSNCRPHPVHHLLVATIRRTTSTNSPTHFTIFSQRL